jgi:O-methyltransferase
MDNAFLIQHFHWKPRHHWMATFANKALGKLRLPVRIDLPEPAVMGSLEFRINLFHLADGIAVSNIPGDFVEVGCNAGYSSVILQKILLEKGAGRKLHCFDSFGGLPDSLDPRDRDLFRSGDMLAARQWFDDHFRKMNLPLPEVYQGWFEDTLPTGLPERISFALIDADLYSSTLTALRQVYPKLSPGAVCMLGVYCDDTIYKPTLPAKYTSPGAKTAADEFMADKPERFSVMFAGGYSSGYFRKV